MFLCAERPCNAFRSIQALPRDCIWLMGEAAVQRGPLCWTSSFGTIKVSALRIKLLCARSRAFPVCGSRRNTPRDWAASGILSQHETSSSDDAEHTCSIDCKDAGYGKGLSPAPASAPRPWASCAWVVISLLCEGAQGCRDEDWLLQGCL